MEIYPGPLLLRQDNIFLVGSHTDSAELSDGPSDFPSSCSIPAFTCFEAALLLDSLLTVIPVLCCRFQLSCKNLTLGKASWGDEKSCSWAYIAEEHAQILAYLYSNRNKEPKWKEKGFACAWQELSVPSAVLPGHTSCFLSSHYQRVTPSGLYWVTSTV